MKKVLTWSFATMFLVACAIGQVAWATPDSIGYNPGTAISILDFLCQTTYHCNAQVPIDTNGASLATAPGTGNTASALPVQGVAGGVAVPVSGTFWQSTQPVSGTVTASQGTAANLNATVVGTGTFATQSTVSQATASSLNATVVGTGTFATQAAQSGTWNITNVSGTVSLPTGAATATNQTTANTSLATIATNTGSAIPAGANLIGYTSSDACSQGAKLGASISLTASGQLITGTASKKTYICSIDIISATAQNIALVEGTGSTCATNIFGLAGGTTAATGWNLPANGGLTKGSGAGTVYSPSADANATAANVCLLLSGSGQTSGQITYVQQ